MAARSRTMFGQHRRRVPVVRLVLVFCALLLAPSLLAAAPLAPWTGPIDGAAGDGREHAAEPARSESLEQDQPTGAELPAAGTPAFARVDDVTLHLPATEVVLVGFHEASSREARGFVPIGRLEDHQNTTRFDPPEDAPDGPAYVVLSSRGRPFPATSAIDVLLDADAPVRSPVTGTVTDVRGYHLYGRHADQRIEIAPAVAPQQRIVMIHLDGVSVSVGDEVVVGETVVAGRARLFSFGSHIDRYTEPHRYPHVHYEIKRAAD